MIFYIYIPPLLSRRFLSTVSRPSNLIWPKCKLLHPPANYMNWTSDLFRLKTGCTITYVTTETTDLIFFWYEKKFQKVWEKVWDFPKSMRKSMRKFCKKVWECPKSMRRSMKLSKKYEKKYEVCKIVQKVWEKVWS